MATKASNNGNLLPGISASLCTELCSSPNNVVTSLNYYDDPGDGSLPEPVYIEA
jgi:hypothetical protein